MTVIVDHDTGVLLWARPGRDSTTLAKFFDALGETRCAAITHVSADAATATMAGSNTVVAFPITGGHISLFDKSVQANGTPWIQGEVDHSGGLTFSAGGKEVTVTNFIVDPGKSLLTATAGGAQVPLLFLDGTNVAVSKDAAGHVLLDGTVAKLTQQAADALNITFGVSLFQEGHPGRHRAPDRRRLSRPSTAGQATSLTKRVPFGGVPGAASRAWRAVARGSGPRQWPGE